MKTCDGCTLCCKLARVHTDNLDKPTNVWCRHCDIGKGCKIYDHQPQMCKDFFCGWIMDESLADELRPDRVHLYPSGQFSEQVLKIIVDPEHADSWQTGKGAQVVKHFLSKGFHLLIVCDKQVNFLNAVGKPQPEKLIIDWAL